MTDMDPTGAAGQTQTSGATDVTGQPVPGASSTQPGTPPTALDANGEETRVPYGRLEEVVAQRNATASELAEAQRQVAELKDQLAAQVGTEDLKKLVDQDDLPMEEDRRVMQLMQQAAALGAQSAMRNVPIADLKRVTTKDRIQAEAGQALTHPQLNAAVDIAMKYEGMPGDQALALARMSKPELFQTSTDQGDTEPPPALPPSHQVMQPTGETRRVPQPTAKTGAEEFDAARERGDRAAMKDSLGKMLHEELVAPAWGSPSDKTGRVVRKAERKHVRAPGRGG